MSVPPQQVQSFRDIQVGGDGNSLVINQTVVISPEVVQARTFVDRSPYIGLRRFEAQDQTLFFGRDTVVAKLILAVRDHRFTVVAGASGSGKSSVVRAGLIPQFHAHLARLRVLTMVPDRDPFARLHAALLQAGFDLDDVAEASTVSDQTLLALCTKLRGPQEPWILFIDQFEEVFTLCGDLARRQAFLDGLVRLVELGPPEVKLVVAMRADFFDRFDPHPKLLELAQPPFFVTSPSEAELRQCIEQPAAQHGVTFEAGLVSEILSDLKGQPGALPLLQYSLDLLWTEDQPAKDRTLNTDNYHKLGGVSGALKQRADELYQFSAVDRQRTKKKPRPAEQREAMRRVFLRLLDLSEQGENARAISNRALLSELPAAEQTLVSELADDKLLVTNRTKDGQATVEVAHEALLTAWPQLQEWIAQTREAIFLRNRLRVDAALWDKARATAPERAADELWTGSRLHGALDQEARGVFAQIGELSSLMREFLTASRALRDRRALEEQEQEELRTQMARQKRQAEDEERQRELERSVKSRQRSRQLALIAIAVAVLMGGLGLFSLQLKQRADLARIRAAQALQSADRSLVAQLEEQGRVELLAGDPAKAAVYLVKARQLGGDTPALRFLLAQSLRHVERRVVTLTGHHGPVTNVAFSTGGARVLSVSQDRTVRVWNSATGKELLRIADRAALPIRATFTKDGDFIISENANQTWTFWDAYHERTAVLTIPLVEGQPPLMAVSPSGKRLAVLRSKLRSSLYDTETGALMVVLEGLPCEPTAAEFASNAKRLATRCDDGTVSIFDAVSGKSLRLLRGHAGKLLVDTEIASLSYSGSTVVIELADGNQESWNPESASHTFKRSEEQSKIRFRRADSYKPYRVDELARNGALTLSPKGKQAVLSRENKLVALLDGHRDRVNCAAFSRDGSRVATGSEDGTVRIWDTSDGQQPLEKPRRLRVDLDRKAELCPIDIGQYSPIWRLGAEIGAGGGSARFPPDSGIAAISVATRSLVTRRGHLCDLETDKSIALLETGITVKEAAFSPDGKRVVTIGSDKSARIWDTKTGKLGPVLGPHLEEVIDVSFSPDGQQVITVSGETATLWDAGSAKRLTTLAGHTGLVQRALFSPDGRTVLTVSNDRTARLWEKPAAGFPLVPRILSGHSGAIITAAFTVDGTRLVTGSYDGSAMVRQVKNGQILASIEGHTGPVLSVKFSPDGERVVTGSADHSVGIWDSHSGRLLATYLHSEWVGWAAFSAQGDRLLTMNDWNNSELLEWDVQLESRAAQELSMVLRRQRIPWILDEALVLVDVSALVADAGMAATAPGPQPAEPSTDFGAPSRPRLSMPPPGHAARSCSGASAQACYDESLKVRASKDVQYARWLLTESCRGGSAIGCIELGLRIEKGEHSAKDEAQAATFYARACDLGEAAGCQHLANRYEADIGVPRDLTKRVELLSRACELISPAACYKSGEAWFYGWLGGPHADAARAMEYFNKGCNQGNSELCLILGAFYKMGLHVTPSAARAADYFSKGCDRGGASSCLNLGELYKQGLGVAPSPSRAAELIAKASCPPKFIIRTKDILECRKPAAYEVVPGTGEVRGSLSGRTIPAIVRYNYGSVRDCFALGGSPTRQHTDQAFVRVAFEIDSRGVVIQSAVKQSTLGNSNVEQCLLAAVRRWEFPKPGGGTINVAYSFRPTIVE